MTIKWVVSDPLLLNGEPFCYGSRLTVRNVLELRRGGYTLTQILKDHPELRPMGIAAAYAYAAANRPRYAEFFEADGSLVGPGYTEDEARGLPEPYRLRGVVIKEARTAEPPGGEPATSRS
jgi:uncharacterized protein (DUF433 family)